MALTLRVSMNCGTEQLRSGTKLVQKFAKILFHLCLGGVKLLSRLRGVIPNTDDHFRGCSRKWPNDTLFCFVCCGINSQTNHVILFASDRGDLIFAYTILVDFYIINSLVYTKHWAIFLSYCMCNGDGEDLGLELSAHESDGGRSHPAEDELFWEDTLQEQNHFTPDV